MKLRCSIPLWLQSWVLLFRQLRRIHFSMKHVSMKHFLTKRRSTKQRLTKQRLTKCFLTKRKVDKTLFDETKVDETKVDKMKVDKTKVDETKVDELCRLAKKCRKVFFLVARSSAFNWRRSQKFEHVNYLSLRSPFRRQHWLPAARSESQSA
jgi:hypothetical protein